MIQVQRVCKQYGPYVAVADLSFEIPRGQIVAMLGPNGAGKTTTMKILTGFIAPTSGTAAVAGFDLRTDRLAAAAQIGYLPENGPLYPDMTPRRLLRFCAQARALPGREREHRIDVVIDECGLADVASKPIGKLSKGLRQRVGLAQALLHDPAVLIMDEPTAGLDPNQIRHFRAQLLRVRQSKTVVLSTHALYEAEAVADRVLLIHRGRLVFDGAPVAMRADGSLEQRFHDLTGGGRAADSGATPNVR
jgi:ABC-2 type transport system ATP-binding protein